MRFFPRITIVVSDRIRNGRHTHAACTLRTPIWITICVDVICRRYGKQIRINSGITHDGMAVHLICVVRRNTITCSMLRPIIPFLASHSLGAFMTVNSTYCIVSIPKTNARSAQQIHTQRRCKTVAIEPIVPIVCRCCRGVRIIYGKWKWEEAKWNTKACNYNTFRDIHKRQIIRFVSRNSHSL